MIDRKLYCGFIILAGLVCVAGQVKADDHQVAIPPATRVFEIEEHPNIIYRDLEKGEHLSVGNRLDVYLPKSEKNFPVVFLVHGGAWVAGDKKIITFAPAVARSFARRGFGVVAMNYRLYPWVRHPGPVIEVAKALAWTERHIADYGGRADEIFLVGHSAGGHIVTLLATDKKYALQEGADLDRVRGVVALSGVYVLSDVALQLWARSSKACYEVSLKANPYSLIFGKDSKIQKDASPIAHVGHDLPPFLLVYAEHELPTLTQMTFLFEDALLNQGIPVQLCKAEDRNHATEFWNLRKPEDPVAQTIVDFMMRHRKQSRD